MRKLDIPAYTSSLQSSQYKRRIQFPSKSSGLASFQTPTGVLIPPLNLTKPISHSVIFGSAQKLQRPETSTRRQDSSYRTTQRSHRTNQQLLSQRHVKQENLLNQNKILRAQNEKLKRQVNQHKRDTLIELQRNRVEIFRLKSQNRELFLLADLNEKQRKSKQHIQNSKQSQLYIQIIQKLERRVDLLLRQSQALKESLQAKVSQLSQAQSTLRSFESIRRKVLQLEFLTNEDTKQWQNLKRQWIRQKEDYTQYINRLQYRLKYQ